MALKVMNKLTWLYCCVGQDNVRFSQINKATRSIISWIHGEFIDEIHEMFSLNRSPVAARTFGRLDFFPSVANSDRIGPCNRWGQDVGMSWEKTCGK